MTLFLIYFGIGVGMLLWGTRDLRPEHYEAFTESKELTIPIYFLVILSLAFVWSLLTALLAYQWALGRNEDKDYL
jgi:hypothetical protein